MEAAAERTKRKAAQSTPLIRALGLAHYWQRLLDEARFQSITDIAAAEGTMLRRPGGCRATARQSRCGDQSGERAAPSDAACLAGAGRGVCGEVFSRIELRN